MVYHSLAQVMFHRSSGTTFQQSISKHIERVHEGKRPYSCDTCDAGFSNKLRLARHIASEKCIVLKKQAPNEDIKPTHEEKKL